MMTARLFAHNSGVPVVHVEVPPFDSGYPPIILWRSHAYARASDDGDYLEVFAFVATVEVIDKNDPRRDPEPGARSKA